MIELKVKERAGVLRKSGKSHRQIAKKLKISLGSAFLFTRNIKLTIPQHLALKRANLGFINALPEYLRKEASRRGGQNTETKFKPKHNKEQLLKFITDFHYEHGRIPAKREFYNHWQPYRRVFGQWNKAIEAAGFKPNPVLFSKKWISKDGHQCDSFSEKIIDDILNKNGLFHERSVYYPNQRKFTVDFLVDKRIWLEFVGLKGVLRNYDKLLERKRDIARRNGIEIVEIAPNDLFPVKDLEEKLITLMKQKQVF